MRILTVGAGGVGGYFGARLAEKGEDVTFLVREKKKKKLIEQGLRVNSIHGDIQLTPSLITSNDKAPPFDLVIFTTKAYHLEQAIQDVRPFIDDQTLILPLLNGVAHYETLDKAFGENVIGGLCFIESAIDSTGAIRQTSQAHRLVYGSRSNRQRDRIEQLQAHLSGTKADFLFSTTIEQEIWHKYLFITVASGITTLFRSSIGPIISSEEGRTFIRRLLTECVTIMKAEEAPLSPTIIADHMRTFESVNDNMKSSMLRDMEQGSTTEAHHLQGYLMERAAIHGIEVPTLSTVYTNVSLYEASLT
ncbi:MULTISPECIES: ketopantoate reductase family protein [Bacillaceae]|uniref:2-dehydropantoate 2-reductase n=1 Tax=Alkalicoccobacillus plakortidis TaxID=444060 RepID=A0A9D5DRF7_9BACI|nr:MULTISPECIES: ketopantoate reductase family protein [Bacillaceae]KQL56611.1 2-dehydropantoate 2-reductase [Alkalicoccobacillus plakortidis]